MAKKKRTPAAKPKRTRANKAKRRASGHSVTSAKSNTAKAARSPSETAAGPPGRGGAERFPTLGPRLQDTVRPSGGEIISERSRDAARKADKRRASRIVEITPCEDPARRKRLEKDIFKWLPWYFPEIYDRPCTEQITAIIRSILAAIREGGDQGIAAPRGEGKTTSSENVVTFCALKGEIPFAILFEATGPLAQDSLAAIMERLETNDRLAADYPEICIPIRALNHTAQLARTQLVSGKRHDNGQPFEAAPSNFKWCGREIVLPHVPGAPGAGAIIATRGLDAAVRGVKRGGKALRPSVAIINDPDTDNTVENPEQGRKLEKKIERSIGALGGQKKRVARVLLTTVQRRGTVSDKYTDPKQKPSFRGKRLRFLVKKPDRMDLWEEYMQLRQQDLASAATDDKPSNLAGAFYKTNRAKMDAGAIVANPARRGDESELSALQFYFNEQVRLGAEGVATEYDNDPPEESGPVESGITAYRIQRQVNGFDRKIVPDGCTVVSQGIDCKKAGLHCVSRAWEPDGTGYTIHYEFHETHGTVGASEEGLDLALIRAIVERMEAIKESPYRRADGTPVPVMLTLVDAGWRTSAVYQACRQVGLGIMPAKGYGRSAGCVQVNFSNVQKRSRDRAPGDNWFLSRQADLWLVNCAADAWKAWEHDRWMTEPGRIGSMTLWGERSPTKHLSEDEKFHFSYSKHLTAEVEAEEVKNGVLKRYWKALRDTNHYFDASYLSDVAANICGIRLDRGGATAPPAAPAQREQPSNTRFPGAPPADGSQRTRW